ncbi:hypothetical protein THAOC_23535, partial [Thalassiosira oceanica]
NEQSRECPERPNKGGQVQLWLQCPMRAGLHGHHDAADQGRRYERIPTGGVQGAGGVLLRSGDGGEGTLFFGQLVYLNCSPSNRFLLCLLMLRSRTLCLIRKTIHFRKEDIGEQSCPVGELCIIKSALYQYDDTPGKRVIGIQVEFVDACDGKVYINFLEVTYSGTSCEVSY